jgi:hypothetical protein
MEDVYAGESRAGGWSLDLLDGGGDGRVGASEGSSLTIICSPGLRPRLASGSSDMTVST